MTSESSTDRNGGLDDHPAVNEPVIDISNTIATARACLADFLLHTSEEFDGQNYAVRRNYWRILRASRHLSNFESSSVTVRSPPMKAASIVLKPEPPAPVVIADFNIVVKSGEVQNTITPLITTPSVPSTSVSEMTIQIATVATVKADIPLTHSSTDNTAELLHVVSDDRAISDTVYSSLNISMNPDSGTSSAAIPAGDSSSPDISTPTDIAILSTDANAALIFEDYYATCRAEALLKFKSKMSTIHHDTHFQTWLEVIKGYWSALRVARRGPMPLAPALTPALALVAEAQTNVKVPVRIPLSYTSSNQMTAHSGDHGINSQLPTVDLTSDRMHMLGFAGIARKLPYMHPAEVNMTLWGIESFDQWPSLVVSTNPSYSYEDNPLPGWTKNIGVRMGGKGQGSLEITYSPPERTRRMRSKMEIQAYFTKYNLPNSLVNRFDFRSVFCVCHTPEDKGSYLECSFGRAGCNKWLHPQCVGLGRKKEGELRDMVTVVCPFCTVYLESIGAKDYLKNKLCLRKVSITAPLTSVVVNGFEIFESSRPHTEWGIPHTVSKATANEHVQSMSSSSSRSSQSFKHNQPNLSSCSSVEAVGQQSIQSPNVDVDLGVKTKINMTDVSVPISAVSNGDSNDVNNNIIPKTLSASPHTVRCEMSARHPEFSSTGLHQVSGPSFSPPGGQNPIPQADHILEVMCGANANLSGDCIRKEEVLANDTKSPVGTKVKTPTAARLMSADPTLSSMFMHRLFRGATIPRTSVDSKENQGTDSSSDSPLLFSSLEEMKGAEKVAVDEALVDMEDPMYAVIEYCNSTEPRDRVRWAKVLPSIIGASTLPCSYISTSSVSGSSLCSAIPILSELSTAPIPISVTAAIPPIPIQDYQPSYLRVKVTGGWMKKEGITPDSQSARAMPVGSARPIDANMRMISEEEIELTVEQRVRQRATSLYSQKQMHIQTQSNEPFSLCGRYKRKLLEAVAVSAFSAAHKKKTPNGEVRPIVGYHSHPLDSPLLFYLPSDGGLTAACVSCAPIPSSLHALCASGEMCAFCLHRFDPAMKLYSAAQISQMAKRRREKERRAAAARKRKFPAQGKEDDSEEDTTDSVLHLVSKTVGSVTYTVHRQCAFAADSGRLFAVHSPSLSPFTNLSNSGETVLDHPMNDRSNVNGCSPSDGGEGQEVNNRFAACKGIDLGDLYECDEGDDAECDLCGRAGGIMQFFDLHAANSSIVPPGEEGWLGHIPCVSWLIKSRLLELPPSSLRASGNYSDDVGHTVTVDQSRVHRSGSGERDYEVDKDSNVNNTDNRNGDSITSHAYREDGISGTYFDQNFRHDGPCSNDAVSDPVVGDKEGEGVNISPQMPVKTAIMTYRDADTTSESLAAAAAEEVMKGAGNVIEEMMTRIIDDAPSRTLNATDKAVILTESITLPLPSILGINDCNGIHLEMSDDFVASSSSSVFSDSWKASQDCVDNEKRSSTPNEIVETGALESRMDISSGEDSTLIKPLVVEEGEANMGEERQEKVDNFDRIQSSIFPLEPGDQHLRCEQPSNSLVTQQMTVLVSTISEKIKRKTEHVQHLSLFDSLVGQWRCSFCGTHAGVVLKCAAVACTVRAHPLCVTIAGHGWSTFTATPHTSTSSLSALNASVNDCNMLGEDQKIGETDCALGFLCVLHSPKSRR